MVSLDSERIYKMPEPEIKVPPLVPYSEIQDQIESTFNWLETEIRVLLPAAIIEHIGSSSVPGSLTKGDVDVMVQVDNESFTEAKEALDTKFSYNPEMPPEEQFVSYSGEYQGVDFGIQLVSGDDDQFEFIRWREALRADSELLRAYNEAKQARAHLSMEEYREAKSALILSYLGEEV